MIFTMLLVPPLLLCLMLALGRYEEHMLDPRRLERQAPQRHLSPVPEPEAEQQAEAAPDFPGAPAHPDSQAA
ncbi:hypothetical protein [Streptomyces sp. NPDC058674]|uniref:hypothetical protein n=1 Tax=Streptomyces sp. NPDC058674 TaxID=3346592 RepID=UPI0036481FC2